MATRAKHKTYKSFHRFCSYYTYSILFLPVYHVNLMYHLKHEQQCFRRSRPKPRVLDADEARTAPSVFYDFKNDLSHKLRNFIDK